jgi:HEAT repeat protein
MLALVAQEDTTRCTWEGRLPDRGAVTASVESPAEVARLTAILRSGTKNERQSAARALGALGDNSAIPSLIAAAALPEKHVASQAVWALGRLRGPVVEQALITALASSDHHIQQAAACGLGRVGSSGAVTPLKAMLKSANQFVASAAAWSINRIEHLPRPPE